MLVEFLQVRKQQVKLATNSKPNCPEYLQRTQGGYSSFGVTGPIKEKRCRLGFSGLASQSLQGRLGALLYPALLARWVEFSEVVMAKTCKPKLVGKGGKKK